MSDKDLPESTLRFFDAVEKRLKKAITALLVLLLVVQFCLQYTPIRYWLSPTEQLEGERIEMKWTKDTEANPY